ncbi:MAG TPA: hypothetical protein DCS23_00125 [Candidatus Yonathbacteria bacterium]|nr:hypothetical protein [Candidatus Yonathbacteria bacterium]
MKIKIIFYLFLLTIPNLLFAVAGDFTRSLSIGMRGEDVRELQKILNRDSETRVADIGAGSPRNETNYFGPATKRALIKFQEKHRAEVLAPIGLFAGTGFFGEKTRVKAISILNTTGASAVVVATPTLAPSTATIQKGEVIVMFPSQYSGRPGTMITLSGEGFTPTDNTIYFGDGHAVEKASSWNGQAITFKIPAIPKGNYSLYVKNARGDSNKDVFFVVTDGVTPEPKIESINPSRATLGATVTINGSGFTADGNTLRTGVNIVEKVPSTDGTSLSFVVPLDAFSATTSFSSAKKTSFPIWVHIVNENGVSNGKSFELEI